MQSIKTIIKCCNRLELYILACFGLAETVVMFGNAVGRYFFEYTFPWAEEVTRILFVWSMFLAITTAFIRNGHIGFTALAEKNRLTKAISELAYDITLLAVGFIMAVYGWKYNRITGSVPLPGTDLPTSVFLLPGVFAGTVWAATGAVRLFQKLKGAIGPAGSASDIKEEK